MEENQYPPDTQTEHSSYEQQRRVVAMKRLKEAMLQISSSQQSNPPIPIEDDHLLSLLPSPLRMPNHPPYAEMIIEAIRELKEEMGSAENSISDFIKLKHPDLPFAHPFLLVHHIQKLVDYGAIIRGPQLLYTLPKPNPSFEIGNQGEKNEVEMGGGGCGVLPDKCLMDGSDEEEEPRRKKKQRRGKRRKERDVDYVPEKREEKNKIKVKGTRSSRRAREIGPEKREEMEQMMDGGGALMVLPPEGLVMDVNEEEGDMHFQKNAEQQEEVRVAVAQTEIEDRTTTTSLTMGLEIEHRGRKKMEEKMGGGALMVLHDKDLMMDVNKEMEPRLQKKRGRGTRSSRKGQEIRHEKEKKKEMEQKMDGGGALMVLPAEGSVMDVGEEEGDMHFRKSTEVEAAEQQIIAVEQMEMENTTTVMSSAIGLESEDQGRKKMGGGALMVLHDKDLMMDVNKEMEPPLQKKRGRGTRSSRKAQEIGHEKDKRKEMEQMMDGGGALMVLPAEGSVMDVGEEEGDMHFRKSKEVEAAEQQIIAVEQMKMESTTTVMSSAIGLESEVQRRKKMGGGALMVLHDKDLMVDVNTEVEPPLQKKRGRGRPGRKRKVEAAEKQPEAIVIEQNKMNGRTTLSMTALESAHRQENNKIEERMDGGGALMMLPDKKLITDVIEEVVPPLQKKRGRGGRPRKKMEDEASEQQQKAVLVVEQKEIEDGTTTSAMIRHELEHEQDKIQPSMGDELMMLPGTDSVMDTTEEAEPPLQNKRDLTRPRKKTKVQGAEKQHEAAVLEKKKIENRRTTRLGIRHQISLCPTSPSQQADLAIEDPLSVVPSPLRISIHLHDEMIVEAIRELSEEKGSDEESISNFIKLRHPNLHWPQSQLLSHHLERLVEVGAIVVSPESLYALPKPNSILEIEHKQQQQKMELKICTGALMVLPDKDSVYVIEEELKPPLPKKPSCKTEQTQGKKMEQKMDSAVALMALTDKDSMMDVTEEDVDPALQTKGGQGQGSPKKKTKVDTAKQRQHQEARVLEVKKIEHRAKEDRTTTSSAIGLEIISQQENKKIEKNMVDGSALMHDKDLVRDTTEEVEPALQKKCGLGSPRKRTEVEAAEQEEEETVVLEQKQIEYRRTTRFGTIHQLPSYPNPSSSQQAHPAMHIEGSLLSSVPPLLCIPSHRDAEIIVAATRDLNEEKGSGEDSTSNLKSGLVRPSKEIDVQAAAQHQEVVVEQKKIEDRTTTALAIEQDRKKIEQNAGSGDALMRLPDKDPMMNANEEVVPLLHEKGGRGRPMKISEDALEQHQEVVLERKQIEDGTTTGLEIEQEKMIKQNIGAGDGLMTLPGKDPMMDVTEEGFPPLQKKGGRGRPRKKSDVEAFEQHRDVVLERKQMEDRTTGLEIELEKVEQNPGGGDALMTVLAKGPTLNVAEEVVPPLQKKDGRGRCEKIEVEAAEQCQEVLLEQNKLEDRTTTGFETEQVKKKIEQNKGGGDALMMLPDKDPLMDVTEEVVPHLQKKGGRRSAEKKIEVETVQEHREVVVEQNEIEDTTRTGLEIAQEKMIEHDRGGGDGLVTLAGRDLIEDVTEEVVQLLQKKGGRGRPRKKPEVEAGEQYQEVVVEQKKIEDGTPDELEIEQENKKIEQNAGGSDVLMTLTDKDLMIDVTENAVPSLQNKGGQGNAGKKIEDEASEEFKTQNEQKSIELKMGGGDGSVLMMLPDKDLTGTTEKQVDPPVQKKHGRGRSRKKTESEAAEEHQEVIVKRDETNRSSTVNDDEENGMVMDEPPVKGEKLQDSAVRNYPKKGLFEFPKRQLRSSSNQHQEVVVKQKKIEDGTTKGLEIEQENKKIEKNAGCSDVLMTLADKDLMIDVIEDAVPSLQKKGGRGNAGKKIEDETAEELEIENEQEKSMNLKMGDGDGGVLMMLSDKDLMGTTEKQVDPPTQKKHGRGRSRKKTEGEAAEEDQEVVVKRNETNRSLTVSDDDEENGMVLKDESLVKGEKYQDSAVKNYPKKGLLQFPKRQLRSSSNQVVGESFVKEEKHLDLAVMNYPKKGLLKFPKHQLRSSSNQVVDESFVKEEKHQDLAVMNYPKEGLLEFPKRQLRSFSNQVVGESFVKEEKHQDLAVMNYPKYGLLEFPKRQFRSSSNQLVGESFVKEEKHMDLAVMNYPKKGLLKFPKRQVRSSSNPVVGVINGEQTQRRGRGRPPKAISIS